MGDAEDMFTKQEIQAGYVTSGRDVLAKQQLAAGNTTSRRKVGGGGPSGSGKVPSNPVFPPPTYEEPSKTSQTNFVPPPPSTSSTAQFPPVSSSVQRLPSTSAISGFSSVAAAGKMARASSLPISTASNISSAASISSTGSNKSETSLTPAEILSRQQEQLRKLHPQNNTTGNSPKPPPNSNPQPNTSSTQATAASVVAGVHASNKSNSPPPAPHTTLTSLKPLKRSLSVPEKNKQSFPNSDPLQDNSLKLSALRNNSTSIGNSAHLHAGIGSNIPNSTTLPISTSDAQPMSSAKLSSIDSIQLGGAIIGGTVIGSSMPISGSSGIGSIRQRNSAPIGNDDGSANAVIGKVRSSNSDPIGMNNNIIGGQTIGNFGNSQSSAVGGNDLFPSTSLMSNQSDINQWEFNKTNSNGSESLFGGADNFGAIGGQGIWGTGSSQQPMAPTGFTGSNNHLSHNLNGLQSLAPDNNVMGGMNMTGSSALASMLGIQLPTGVGTLRDNLWASSTPLRSPQSSMKINSRAPTPIGAGLKKSNKGVIIGGGQIPVGGMHASATGNPGSNIGGGNTNDIKLLQSLLPGVHITSGDAYQPAAPNLNDNHNITNNHFSGMGWGGFSQAPSNNGNAQIPSQHPQGLHAPIGAGSSQEPKQGNDMWGGRNVYASQGSGPSNNGGNNMQQNGSNIW